MDPKVTQIPGKSLSSKFKFGRKVSEAPKIVADEPPIFRQKRIFGTVRSTNIPIKTLKEKPAAKPSIRAFQKQPKSTQLTQNPANESIKPTIEAASKKFTEKLNPRLKKKSPGIKPHVKETILNDLHIDNVVEPQTPVAFPRLFKLKGRNAATPYHTAEKCSKCRFDKMETSSYWLAQIKLAECVGKHFVSATFFRLAYECNAEPIRSLRVELKHYLTRHEHIIAHTEWKNVSLSYGLLKDEGNTISQNCGVESSSSGIKKDEIETIESEGNSSEPIKEKGEANEPTMLEISSSELDKDQIVGNSVGESGTGTTLFSQSWLSLDDRQIHQS